jgi:hypothetical protein
MGASNASAVEHVYPLEQFKEAFEQSLRSNRSGKVLFGNVVAHVSTEPREAKPAHNEGRWQRLHTGSEFLALRNALACGGLGDLDRVDRDLVGTRIVARVEIHLLTLAQTIDAGALQRGGMDEYILIAIVRPNEAKASLIVEEFHGS